MRLLLDTHTFLWFVNNAPPLTGTQALSLLQDNKNELLLSVASVWEMAIKAGIGKLALAQPLETFVPAQMRANAIGLLPIEPRHAFHVAQLPLHHRDPFDRLLIAQSIVEGMPLLSADATFDDYAGLQRIW